MGSKNIFLILSVAFFLLFVSPATPSAAQQGSVYFSVGYNMAWFGASTIHIDQSDLGNSYNMVRVKGDNHTNTPFSPTQLNYRLGFFYNDVQTHGIELNFDPVNYEITGNRNVLIKGIVNNTFNVEKNVTFSKANGAYYQFTGANFLMLNMVKRVRIYMANTKKIAVDAIGKIGAGPCLPHFASSLPVNPVDDPGLNFAGWNAGVEAGLRVRGYRFIFLDITAKYDYASFNSLAVYDGTARQNLNTYEVIASIGFTFPTTRPNPLFYREPDIVTILPFYQNKEEVSKTIPRRKVKYDPEGNPDTANEKALDSIPEFQEILDRKYKKEHPDTAKKAETDSLGNPIIRDSLGHIISKDSLGNVIMRDSLGNPVIKDTVAAKDTSSGDEHLSRRQLKKKRKAEEKARKAQEQELQQNQQAQPADSAKTPTQGGQEPPAPEIKVPEQKTPDAKEPDKKEPEIKPEEKKEPELSKKERKRKAKEERKAQKEKEKEEKAKQDNPPAPPPPDSPDNKDKPDNGGKKEGGN